MPDRPRKLVAVVSTLTAVFVASGIVASSGATGPPTGQADAAHSAERGNDGGGGGGGEHPNALLPDMTPVQPWQLQVVHVGRSARQLRFSSALANIGVGPMEVRPDHLAPCPKGKRHASQVIYRDADRSTHFNRDVDTGFYRKPAGCMVFHAEHNHWHWEAAARYLLWRPHKSFIIDRARKTSFCMRDSARVPSSLGTFHTRPFYGDCSRNSPQGVSRGFEDIYSYYLEGQSLRLPPRVGNGAYCLGVRVDPHNYLQETDEANNLSVRAFHLHGDHIKFLSKKRCLPES